MKISVLTVCYNSSRTIHHTIASFLAQSWPDKEMVVVDGASADGTPEIVEDYVRAGAPIRLVSEPDEGMYDALNKGLALYAGDAFGVLNSDDAYHDAHTLAHIAEGLAQSDIVHGGLDFVENHDTGRIVRRWQAQPKPEAGFRTGWMPAHPTFYCRRAVADAVGPFDLSLATASDYDWMLRAVELHGHSIACVNHVLVNMQQGGKSTRGWRAHVVHNLEALRARRKWLGVGLVDYALVAKPLGKLGQFRLVEKVRV